MPCIDFAELLPGNGSDLILSTMRYALLLRCRLKFEKVSVDVRFTILQIIFIYIRSFAFYQVRSLVGMKVGLMRAFRTLVNEDWCLICILSNLIGIRLKPGKCLVATTNLTSLWLTLRVSSYKNMPRRRWWLIRNWSVWSCLSYMSGKDIVTHSRASLKCILEIVSVSYYMLYTWSLV